MISGLKKVEYAPTFYRKAVSKIRILGFLNDVTTLQFLLLSSFMGLTHPALQSRTKNVIDKLKRDLDKQDLPPSLRAQIVNDLKLSESYYKNFLEGKDRESHEALTVKVQRFIEERLDGRFDIRDVLLNKLYQNYEDT